MSMLKLKINVNLHQLLCIVISAAQNGEFERFGGFCVDCYHTLFRALTWTLLDISLRWLRFFNIPIHFFIFRTYQQTRRLYGPPVAKQSFIPPDTFHRFFFFLIWLIDSYKDACHG